MSFLVKISYNHNSEKPFSKAPVAAVAQIAHILQPVSRRVNKMLPMTGCGYRKKVQSGESVLATARKKPLAIITAVGDNQGNDMIKQLAETGGVSIQGNPRIFRGRKDE